MWLFDLFKRKSNVTQKQQEQLDFSIAAYKRAVEKGKTIKKSEIADIHDSELEHVVMGWIWGKFNEDWSNQYEVVASLPKPCQSVYSCRTVSDEINNGGLNQLFYNSTGQFAELSVEGFAAMGYDKLSEIMKRAVELHHEHKKVLEKYNDGTMESFMASYDEEIFGDLDDRFYKEESNVDYADYIRKHAECFGD